jgi:hypothetical protein
MSLRKPPERTSALIAANQANGRKSRGRFTEEQIRRAEELAAKYPVRLLGLAEARVLNQEPGAAERLYRELIAPYPHLPPLLERSFQDLARLYLELEAWERIRDAQLEQRWAQNKLTQLRLAAEMERDLQGNVQQYLAGGLQGLPDSPAKLRMQFECLEGLLLKLNRRDFTLLKTELTYLYGKDLSATSDRAETICLFCRRLMEPTPGEEPLGEEEFQRLLDLVNAEELQIAGDYGLARDEKTMTRTACLAHLGPTHESLWMDRQGERLRQAIDRKQWVIIGLLQAFGLAREVALAPNSGSQPTAKDGTTGNSE